MEIEYQRVEAIRKRYPQGTKICLDAMQGEHQMPPGLKGQVFSVDDMGQIHVQWENGSTLALLPGVDQFHKVGNPRNKDQEAESR